MTVTSRSAGDLLTAAIFNTKLEAPITTSELQDGAVTTAKILDANVTTAKIATLPSARVTHASTQSIATATSVALAFDTERFDTDTIHDTATNNSRLTCRTAGKYLIDGNVRFATNGTGRRQISIRLQGATFIALIDVPPNAANPTSLSISTIYQLAVGEYVELIVVQESGGALNIEKVNAYSPEFGMTWLAP